MKAKDGIAKDIKIYNIWFNNVCNAVLAYIYSLHLYIYIRAAALLNAFVLSKSTKTTKGSFCSCFWNSFLSNFALGFINGLDTILARTATSLITAIKLMTVTQQGQKIDHNRQ